MPTNKGQKSPKRPLIFYYAVTLIVLMLLNWLFFPSLLSRQVTEIGYDELVSMVDDGKVETVSYRTTRSFLKRRTTRAKPPSTRPAFSRMTRLLTAC